MYVVINCKLFLFNSAFDSANLTPIFNFKSDLEFIEPQMGFIHSNSSNHFKMGMCCSCDINIFPRHFLLPPFFTFDFKDEIDYLIKTMATSLPFINLYASCVENTDFSVQHRAFKH